MSRTIVRAGAAVGTLCIATTGVALAAGPTETGAQRAPSGTESAPRETKSVPRDLEIGGRKLHVRAGRDVVVKGRGEPGAVAHLQVRHAGAWRTLGRNRIDRRGTFRVRGTARTAATAPGRVVSRGQKRRIGKVHMYRYAQASWYGPGLYGGHLACGGTLTPGTQGVAHKHLPCGAKVTLRNGSRTTTVRVVDRGPYVGAREFDLTAATAQNLRFSGVGSVLVTR